MSTVANGPGPIFGLTAAEGRRVRAAVKKIEAIPSNRTRYRRRNLAAAATAAACPSDNCACIGGTDTTQFQYRPVTVNDYALCLSGEDGCLFWGGITDKCCGSS